MRYLILYLSIIIGVTIVLSTYIINLQNIEKIIYWREEESFLLDLCLIYNNPGSTIIRGYHLSKTSLNWTKTYCNINPSKIDIEKGIDTGFLTLLNITSTINMTKVKSGG